MVRLFRFCLILWITLVSPSFAQGVAPEAYDSWNKDASRAEPLSKMPNPDAALEALRSQIVDWRQTFWIRNLRHCTGRNSGRSIKCIAPVPETGADPLADRRGTKRTIKRRTRAGFAQKRPIPVRG